MASDSPTVRPPLEVIDLGRRSYEEVYALQQERLAQRIAGKVPDALFLVEHDAVVTRGRRSADDDAADVPFPVISIERGGEATYHGPGQLVAYPVIELPEGRRDLHRYLRDLEQVVIDTLHAFDVEGRRADGFTGVWIGPKKVCSIGVAVRRWVAWHGLALNVTTDLSAFGSFAPCGLSASVMTRMADHSPQIEAMIEALIPGEPMPPEKLMAETKSVLARVFRARFGFA